MDYEELILERQELDYEDPARDFDRVDTRFFCFIDFAYRDCTKCKRQCYIIDNNRRKHNGNNH